MSNFRAGRLNLIGASSAFGLPRTMNMTAQHWDGTPSTLENMSALGVRRLLVSCRNNSCGRETLLDVSRYPAGTEIPAFARRLACDRCGRNVDVRPNWQDLR